MGNRRFLLEDWLHERQKRSMGGSPMKSIPTVNDLKHELRSLRRRVDELERQLREDT